MHHIRLVQTSVTDELLTADQEDASMGEECSQWLDRWIVQLKTKNRDHPHNSLKRELEESQESGIIDVGSTVTSMGCTWPLRSSRLENFPTIRRHHELFRQSYYRTKAQRKKRRSTGQLDLNSGMSRQHDC